MIGERLLDLRKDAGLTQDGLAAALKINKHSISAYEREKNEPPDDVKIAMARFFRVSVDYLLGMTDSPGQYGDDDLLRLPESLTAEDRESARDFVDYLAGRRAG